MKSHWRLVAHTMFLLPIFLLLTVLVSLVGGPLFVHLLLHAAAMGCRTVSWVSSAQHNVGVRRSSSTADSLAHFVFFSVVFLATQALFFPWFFRVVCPLVQEPLDDRSGVKFSGLHIVSPAPVL